jgi:hypothetical protein
MGAAKEPEETSPAAGACVLVALAGAALGAAFAIDEALGVLTVVSTGGVAVWWSARHRVSDSSATPPPPPARPSCRECAGHTLLSVTPLEGQKGMSIYTSAPPDRPNYSHVHIAKEATD